jgi:hypothetical protein
MKTEEFLEFIGEFVQNNEYKLKIDDIFEITDNENGTLGVNIPDIFITEFEKKYPSESLENTVNKYIEGIINEFINLDEDYKETVLQEALKKEDKT